MNAWTRTAAAAGATIASLACGACTGSGETERRILLYAGGELLAMRNGESYSVLPTGSGATGACDFSVFPDLPAGLALDAATGEIGGVPTTSIDRSVHTVQCLSGAEPLIAIVEISIGEPLPVEIATLEPGFTAARFARLEQPPGKFAVAPDGRVFVTELLTGWIRVVAADGTLQPAPFATVDVATGGHRGLLGVALSPTFATDGLVFAMAVVPASGGKPERSQILRWRDDGAGVGRERTVLVDDLPAAAINNGGALCFDASGMLLVSVGDTEDPLLAQDDGSLAGKLLRVSPVDGSAPADNPAAGDPIFAKGLRNTYALALHPDVDAVFGADNGPTTDDELNLMQGGKNFEWGANGAAFGVDTGARLRHWPDVVVPTGLAFRPPADGGGAVPNWPDGYGDALFGSFYDGEVVERFVLSGALRTDIDSESEFLRFAIQGNANKPIDVQFGPAGRLFVLTNAAVFRVDRLR